ncbi:bile acid:sodium symporter family protein [Breznakiellaceae bacterium SP9]
MCSSPQNIPVQTALRLNKKLELFLPLLIPIGAALGIIFPGVFIRLRPIAFWLFGFMTLTGALNLRVREFVNTVKNPLPLLLFFASARVVMPALVVFLVPLVFPSNADVLAGFVLLNSVPTAVTGLIWTSMFHGDRALSLSIILFDALLSPLVVSGSVSLLLNTKVVLDISGIVSSLVFMVVLPSIIGVSVNELSRTAIPRAVNPYLAPFSKFCVVCVVAANSAAVAPFIRFDKPELWVIMISCTTFSILGFCLAKLLGLLSRQIRETQVTLFFAIGLRNTSAAMTIAIDFFPPNAAMPAVLGIIFQQSLSALMARILLRKGNR